MIIYPDVESNELSVLCFNKVMKLPNLGSMVVLPTQKLLATEAITFDLIVSS